jgi:hypothetical protein
MSSSFLACSQALQLGLEYITYSCSIYFSSKGTLRFPFVNYLPATTPLTAVTRPADTHTPNTCKGNQADIPAKKETPANLSTKQIRLGTIMIPEPHVIIKAIIAIIAATVFIFISPSV